MPAGFQFIYPNTFNDIINIENTVYPNNTTGIWKTGIDNINNVVPSSILFVTISQNGGVAEDFIIVGQSINPNTPFG